jgi:hypothetical protein
MTVPSVFLKLTTRNTTMDMTMSSIRPNRVEVVTSVQRRRRWTPEQKLEIVKQTNEPGSSVSLVARQHGLTAIIVVAQSSRIAPVVPQPPFTRSKF